ncbi:DUF4263 domain-containing protein [Streptomyces sp. NBC_01335]|uniref:Shedu anti-phage system protein SduA domain-containing protein n=1 Tax=Streptomyces sp. NBC_01335 TaxID=2903828 RepID=UPI002E1521A9|nr:DUF4263 domain-containing protein [Streptomyces sp. NBC_01335]
MSKAQQLISREFLTHIHDADGTPTGVELSATRPRQVVVIGNLRGFTRNGRVNPEKIDSFELHRASIQDVETMTFDELCRRACLIVEDRYDFRPPCGACEVLTCRGGRRTVRWMPGGRVWCRRS